jgi:hypothetical protein
MTPEQMQQLHLNPALAGGMMIGILFVALVIHLFFAFCLAKIAEKLGMPFGKAFIMAVIPIANIILLLQLAGKPLWWIILFIVPLVNLVIAVMVWMAIIEKRGRPAWQVILLFIPIANLVLILMLAFGK